DRDTGGEEREDRNSDPCGEWAEAVLEQFRQPRSGAWSAIGCTSNHRNRESEDDTCDRRMNAGGVQQRPGDDAEREEDAPGGRRMRTEEPAVALHEEREQRHRNQEEQQR